MASARSIEVKVGILILTAVGLLAAFIIVMGGINFQPTYPIYVDFDNPGGLQGGAPVKIAGVKVGKISEIQFRGGLINTATGKRDPLVRIKLEVEKRYAKSIHDNALFYVTTQGVLGEQFLAIEPGSTDRPVVDANTVVRGLDPPRLDMLLAEGYELLHSAVTGVREHKEEIGEAFDSLRKTLKGTGDLLDRNGGKLDHVIENVDNLTQHADDAVKGAKAKFVDDPKIERIITNVDATARDAPAVMADAKETMANAKRISATLGSEAEQAKIRQAVNDLTEVASRAKAMSGDAQAVVSQIRRGKGTVGAIVMDEQLYDDLQEMVRDLKHNPWKFFWRE